MFPLHKSKAQLQFPYTTMIRSSDRLLLGMLPKLLFNGSNGKRLVNAFPEIEFEQTINSWRDQQA